jgi:NAD(P)-dependent dehydrogenase (short-subunit alcohol dehydrogenase family)
VPGADVLGVAADLSDAAGVETLLAGLPKVDILVNNAGIFGPRTSSRPMTRPGSATGRPT